MFGILLVVILILGTYMNSLRHREQAIEPVISSDLAAAPVTGRQERIRLLVAYDDDQALRWRETVAFMPADRGLRAREALRAVLAQYSQNPSPHPLGRGADIKNVYLITDDTMVVDTTAEFADRHPSGILLEELTMTSLIETLSANVPGIAKVKFLVDGQERETLAGHADLMSFYQTRAIHELAKEFE
ncbi:MAG TPA: GerMN domain-containing protein [Terriglobales bacterium]